GATGILQAAKWIDTRELTDANQVAVGHEIFRVECESCHTANAYRGLNHYIALRQWDQNKIQAMVGGLEFMHNGVMPAFAGTDPERAALAAYLSSVHPIAVTAPLATDGQTVYEQNCSMCHQVNASDKLFKYLPQDANAASDAMKDLISLFPLMPDLKLSDKQRMALAQRVN